MNRRGRPKKLQGRSQRHSISLPNDLHKIKTELDKMYENLGRKQWFSQLIEELLRARWGRNPDLNKLATKLILVERQRELQDAKDAYEKAVQKYQEVRGEHDE